MQEVTIKLTLDEAKELRTIIGNKIDESKSVADIICKSKESEIPAWLEKQISYRIHSVKSQNESADRFSVDDEGSQRSQEQAETHRRRLLLSGAAGLTAGLRVKRKRASVPLFF